MISLSDGSEVLLTDAFYSGPDGEPIDHPLIPDVTVVDFGGPVVDSDDPTEDAVLEKGLELLSGSDEEDDRNVA
jgi:C-terminal processing protease CtpA/Prc